MNSIKSKLFGDNKFNFYGWIFGGTGVIAGSVVCLISAVKTENTFPLFIGIYLVLLGIFGILLQNYHSRVAEKLEKEEKN